MGSSFPPAPPPFPPLINPINRNFLRDASDYLFIIWKCILGNFEASILLAE